MGPRIVGDPLTGSIPVTKLVLIEEARPRRARPPSWPIVADPWAVSADKLVPGYIAYYRTRRGIRRGMIRMVCKSGLPTNRGRHFVVTMNRRGWCRAVWADRIVSVQSPQQALNAAKALKAIGPGR